MRYAKEKIKINGSVNAKILNKKATCLLTVVDSKYYKMQTTSEQREKSVNDMIKLALETAIEL